VYNTIIHTRTIKTNNNLQYTTKTKYYTTTPKTIVNKPNKTTVTTNKQIINAKPTTEQATSKPKYTT